MRGGENFAVQVCDSVTELVVTRREKAAPLAVKVMAYVKSGVAGVSVMKEVWEI